VVTLNPAQRFRELTAAVAKAFRAAGGDSSQLTRQELGVAVGVAFGEEELLKGLERLDAENKVFLAGDLVFMI